MEDNCILLKLSSTPSVRLYIICL